MGNNFFYLRIMKTNLICRFINLNVAFILLSFIFSNCSSPRGAETSASDTAFADTASSDSGVSTSPEPPSNDTVALTNLVKKLLKWHETSGMQFEGFPPLKNKTTDTTYSGINLEKNKKAIEELRQMGMFAESFLSDYRKIAVRMDKELRDGSSFWREGEIPTFSKDVNEWCNCQDYPDNYLSITKLTDIQITNNKAQFKWTWGEDFYYTVTAIKNAGTWKISYLEGFDMSNYNWGWWKKNKDHSGSPG
ncbi:hypothetical protein BDE36_0242 [Arcticibacter tournemirensis]|nr:hypothetical protein BDE36_0242 [Arcticibacter tournemirensis]